MVQKSGVHHLRLVLYPPYVQGFFRTIPGGCLGFQPSTVVSLANGHELVFLIGDFEGTNVVTNTLFFCLGFLW